jgi:hypothetical protein
MCPPKISVKAHFFRLVWQVLAIESGRMPQPLTEFCNGQFCPILEEHFVGEVENGIPVSAPSTGRSSLPMLDGELRMNLDGEDGALYIRIFELASSSKKQDQLSLSHLSPLMRFLSAAQMSTNGNLDDVDALLGCGIMCAKESEDFHRLSTEAQTGVCTMLWHSINWFRELVSTFALQNNDEMRGKVHARLNSIITLQKDLEDKILLVSKDPEEEDGSDGDDDEDDNPKGKAKSKGKGKAAKGKGKAAKKNMPTAFKDFRSYRGAPPSPLSPPVRDRLALPVSTHLHIPC